jgi:hypothetical protein
MVVNIVLFQFVLYLFQACGDAKSKPGFLSDKTLESSIKYIVRRFPSIDIKGVSPVLFWCFLRHVHIARVCGWSDLSTMLHACRYNYSKTCLKRNLKGAEHFSTEARFPFNQGIL